MIIKTNILKYLKLIGICLWPFIFVRKDASERTINHEKIHYQQQIELFIIGFYVLYAVWSIKYGYKNNPLEIEAFNNDDNLDYLLSRKRYNYFK